MTGSESKDEPDTHEPRERVDEAVLEDEGERIDEAQYVHERNADQLEELSTLFLDFAAVVSVAADDVGHALQNFHDSMTERLNDKVAELHDLRVQNAVMERKLMNIHELFSQGQECARLIINFPHAAELRETDVALRESPREVADLSSEPQQHTEPQAQPPNEIEHPVTFSVLSDDVLGTIFSLLCNVLEPCIAVDFSSACRGQRALTQGLRQQLRAEHEVAAMLCLKMGMRSCKELRKAKMVYWDDEWQDSGLFAADLSLLGTLGSVLPALEQLALGEYSAGAADPDGVQQLAEGLGAGALPAVTFLQLVNMHVGDAGASALAAALSRGALPRLEILQLSNTAIGDAGLVALAPALRRLPALETIFLWGNPLGDEGIAALVAPPPSADALSPPTGVLAKLKELHLADTEVSDAGCATLASALDSGALPALKEIDLEGIFASAGAEAVVQEALSKLIRQRAASLIQLQLRLLERRRLWRICAERQLLAYAACAALPPPMTAEEALAKAEAEGLTMARSDGQSGFRNVSVQPECKARPYQAWVWRATWVWRGAWVRRDEKFHLGSFATAEVAALHVARTPEAQAAGSAPSAGNVNFAGQAKSYLLALTGGAV